ncbi:MAG: DUF2795 domain-containing protein [Rhodospirillales bacterium]|nr:DUF2795 domain-containing protein [Rhodospirillales bacterium]
MTTTTGHVSANLNRFLKGIDFPAKRADLVEQARENGADYGVLEVLNNLQQRDYESMADVMKAYSEVSV